MSNPWSDYGPHEFIAEAARRDAQDGLEWSGADVAVAAWDAIGSIRNASRDAFMSAVRNAIDSLDWEDAISTYADAFADEQRKMRCA
jgi:hypothetical protein